MTTSASQSAVKRRAAIVSVLSNTSLIALKVAAGVVTGSVGILSDAAHSLMDLIASVIAFASVRKSDEPADATHRYGHEKLEDLAAGGQALLLLLGAAFIAFEAIRRLVDGGKVTSVGIGVIVAALACVTNVVVSAYLARTGRTTGSAALHATAIDLRTDAIVSLGVVASLAAFALTGDAWIDPIAGLVIAAAITTSGVRILLDSARRLVDEALPAEELAQLHAVVGSFLGDEVVGFHDLRARHVGSNHQVDLHLQFVAGTSLERAHAISHRLQDAIISGRPCDDGARASRAAGQRSA